MEDAIQFRVRDEQEALQERHGPAIAGWIESGKENQSRKCEQREGPVGGNDAGEPFYQEGIALRHADHGHDETAQDEEYVDPKRTGRVPRAQPQTRVSLDNAQRSDRAKDLEIRKPALRRLNSG
jgi:hypothetical protein